MAGYYDPNKDYSKELSRTDLSASERSQLETERQNKIDDKYGGVEPNMIGSTQKFSEVYNGGSYSGGSGNSNSGSSVVTDPYNSMVITRREGAAVHSPGLEVTKAPALAGQSVKIGGYTVTFNENGYVTKRVKDNGASATSVIHTAKANNSENHQLAYQAAQAGDWDLAASYINQIAMAGGRNEYGDYDMGEANDYMAELQNEFKYSATDYYNRLYDQAYGEGSAAAFDATGGTIKTYADLVAAMGSEAAQQVVAAQQVQSNGNAGIATNNAVTLLSTGAVGSYGGYDDMTQYINDLYAQNLEAELAALKSAYDSNVAELESQNDRIAEQHRAARNQAAAQNALEAQRMNEIGIAQGLNTGASGQMALAQSAAYQGNLGNLWAQEAQMQADVDLALAQLLNQYNSNVQQTTAQINAQKSQALYDEMVRQQEFAAQQAELSREYAMNLIANGVMPDSATLSSGGISATEAAALVQMVTGGGVTSNAQTATGTGTTTTPTATTPVKKPGVSYNNGSLTTTQVKQLQDYYGVTADGMWGTNSAKAAGGLNADAAWAAYQAANTGMNESNFSAYGRAVMQQLAAGKSSAALNTVNQIWEQLSAPQQATLQKNLSSYGIAYQL